ncbi:MAG: BREX-6 system adenine-specific DNA-methyltransferase PglX [Myxococcales bacterium]|nr:BREX-6 system adenine-specific DNA-methyltransferase PglX [Myxococcales bacterium]
MTVSPQMTSDAKRALSRTIRELRKRLLDDLGAAMNAAYKLSIDAKKATLDESARVRRARLDGWVDEQVRALPAGKRAGAAERLRGDVVKDAAATLLQRLVYLRLLESTGLRKLKVVTGGWESRGYADFREAAPELVRPGLGDETEGYATLLSLVFDELAVDLPGLYGPVRMTALVPVPASTLRAVITALDADELATVWTDDTTLGWIYQYWNDPEREALDAKLAASKKLENHEIASKTQMFTERYMVEWLLHNSLGQMWLAMCRKHGWTADVERAGADGSPSVLDRLDARRADWRAKREAGEVAVDALMPIEPGLEDRWKYWVPQPMPDDAVSSAPDSVRTLKLLDPACGSGHFLVIASQLLFHLYQEEARHRGEAGTEAWSDRRIVESILEHNLHGIDIDPKAVQIAAAALMLKAKQMCADAEPRTMNLVAPNLSLASLPEDDPARLALYAAVEQDTGIPPELTGRIIAALAGADHLGSLLKVDTEIDAAIAEWDAQLSQPRPDQGGLFDGFGPRRRKRITAEHAKATVLSRLEGFLDQHTTGADLGLRMCGEQLAAGVRFVRMVRESQYDLVVGNPPYQGTSKMSDKVYVEDHYPRAKADLYAAFLERGLQLVRKGGVSALLTMRNWMFIKQFSALREWLLERYDLRMLGDVDRGAFDEVPNEVLAAVMSILRNESACAAPGVAMQPTALDDKSYDRERTKRKRAGVLCQTARLEFRTNVFRSIPQTPILYWWSSSRIQDYVGATKLGDVACVRSGMGTGDNVRFLRRWWDVPLHSLRPALRLVESAWTGPANAEWVPFIKGGEGRSWIEPLTEVLRWRAGGLEVRVKNEDAPGGRVVGEAFFFTPGVAFTLIGDRFEARAHRFRSICGNKGSSVFGLPQASLVCMLNSSSSKEVMRSLNPGIGFEVGDVSRLPAAVVGDEKARAVFDVVVRGFLESESHRESSVEFSRPGPSRWGATKDWAQRAVDKPGASLPPFDDRYDDEGSVHHLSFAVGVAVGRFGANGEGLQEQAPPTAVPNGVLFLSDASDDDGLAHPASAPILKAWVQHGVAIDDKRTLKEHLRDKFFPDVHRKMYENRPIYFPLSSAKKSFVAYVSIHRWTSSTLTDLLAEHLYPAKRRLEGEQADLRQTRDGADKKAAKAAEKRLGAVAKWLEELTDFIAKVEQCAEKGPPPPDGRTTAREVDARYEMDLDDGVMINSAALWPLLEPQWKDPKKWWKELANAEGKKDHDWAHLAKRYFPERVDAKCKVDPSLAVAHGCFWKYHPAKAYQWELRLQDEIRPDFTIDEADADAARAAFLADQPDEAARLRDKERQRRQRKQAPAGQSEDEPQGDLDLDGDASDDAAESDEEQVG